MKNKTCNHTFGYTEDDTGYDSIHTYFIDMDDLSLQNSKDLMNGGTVFKFCPDCGVKLEPIFNQKVKELEVARDKRLKEEKEKKEKREKEFQKEVNESAIKTKLNQLPEEGSFVVIFYPTESSFGKNVVLTGPKDHILKNCVNFNSRKFKKDDLIVKEIVKVPSKETFIDIMTKLDWKPKGKDTFEKDQDNVLKSVSFDSEGIIYVTEELTDNNGDKDKIYDRFSINNLGEYLKTDIELEKVLLR